MTASRMQPEQATVQSLQVIKHNRNESLDPLKLQLRLGWCKELLNREGGSTQHESPAMPSKPATHLDKAAVQKWP